MVASRTYVWVVVLSMIAHSQAAMAQAVSGGKSEFSDFWQKFAIAVVSVILGFVSSYILEQIKSRKNPKKQISYNKDVRQGFSMTNEKMPGELKVAYNGKEAHGLYLVSVNVENTGNTVVKNHALRFHFGDESKVMDQYFDPPPQKELGVASALESVISDNERKYTISHLEKGQTVSFKFVVNSKSTPVVEIYPFNDSGDVEFVQRQVKIEADKRHHVIEFMRAGFLFLLLPNVMGLIPLYEIANVAEAAVRVILFFLMIPHAKYFFEVVADAVSASAKRRDISSTVDIVGSEKIDVLSVKTTSNG